MQLRRVLLLFAIVLGFAALAASLTPPPESVRDDTTSPTETARPPEQGATRPVSDGPAELRFVSGDAEPRRRKLPAGKRAIVTVATEEPGQVSIDGLGLLGFAEPGVPARFDILPTRAGRYAVVFRPIEGEPERVGVIVVEAR